MPKGTKVDKLYQVLKDKGMSKGKAAVIAQSKTGLSLKTGKAPMNSMRAMMEGDTSVARKVAKKRG